MEANLDIRLMAKGSGVPLWKIAKVLKISEPTLTRKLRDELSESEKELFQTVIRHIRDGGDHG